MNAIIYDNSGPAFGGSARANTHRTYSGLIVRLSSFHAASLQNFPSSTEPLPVYYLFSDTASHSG